jgi:hypothetical protein
MAAAAAAAAVAAAALLRFCGLVNSTLRNATHGLHTWRPPTGQTLGKMGNNNKTALVPVQSNWVYNQL